MGPAHTGNGYGAHDDGCWGGWTRTNACQSQSLVPYQLGYAPSAVNGLDQRTQVRVRTARSSTGPGIVAEFKRTAAARADGRLPAGHRGSNVGFT